MPGSFGEAAPCYISSRSADVILSDVRPTKLSIDALEAINAFLDELLHTILTAARALTTAQLRAGLHKALPTTLGKEAVLEAELELRAYWERTGSTPDLDSSLVVVEDCTFNLEWTFELLRLKCEAYSTLSDTDENAEAEIRLFQRMSVQGVHPPKQTLLAPASLYLTAIIESICEHIVSNVGRVAARDSSRAVANGQDLFIALCEDSSIYGLFKNMTVYGQIEALSKTSRPRRSMSLARESDGSAFRRNGSRLSSDSVHNATATIHSSRTSVEKPRSVKKLYNKVSQDFINGSDPGHRKIDSFASANTKQSLASKGDRSPISPTFSEDTRSLEFDDMMRSGSTMKVSLTPDRLRTMEAFNKEKARANGQQKPPTKTEKSNNVASHSFPEQTKRTSGSASIHRVGSIKGNEDDRLHKPPPTSRPRQLSAATASAHSVPSFARVRASSTTADSSTALSNTFLSKHTLSEATSVPDQRPASGALLVKNSPSQELADASQSSRSRTVAHSRESLDLEDMMGSDDDGMGELKPFTSPRQRDRHRGFSANTKELIAFLAEGPPDLTPNPSFSATPKKSGRLQKMISRITLASDTVKPPRKMTVAPGDPSSKSMTNLSPLANRPVPPRYPPSASSSVTSSERGSADQAAPAAHPRRRTQSYVQKPTPICDDKFTEGEAIPLPLSPGVEEFSPGVTAGVPMVSQRPLVADVLVQPIKPSPATSSSPPAASVPVLVQIEATNATPILSRQLSPTSSAAPQRIHSPKGTPPLHHKALPARPPLSASTPAEHALEMRTLLAHATSAAECRILVDMFLARSKLLPDIAEPVPASVPSSTSRDVGTDGLESAVVELFLGDGGLGHEHKRVDFYGVESVEHQVNPQPTD